MRPTAELDAGPVYLQRPEPIRPDDDFGSLSARLEELAGDLLVEALDRRPRFEEQPDGVTFADKITAEDRRLPGTRMAAEVERRVRALTPHIGAYIETGKEERLGVLRASDRPTGAPSLAAGDLHMEADRLFFGCADAPLELLDVKPAGGRPMAAAAYVRGRRSRPGTTAAS